MRKVLIAAVILFLLVLAAIFFFRAGGGDEDRRVRVGLVLTGSKSEAGWSSSHFKALEKVSREMDFDLLVRENVSEFDDSAVPVVEDLYGKGVRVICMAGMQYGDKVERMREKYPDAFFLHASGVENSGNMVAFFGKMYQARYLSGIVAGMRTETNRIGFVAAMEVNEVIRGLNAFALGVRSVNPEAEVYVRYSGLWDAKDAEIIAARRIIDERGIDVMTYHQDYPHAARVADGLGLYSILYHVGNDGTLSDRCLTAAIWNWAPFYRERIEDCLYGRFRAGRYWVGLEKGIVDLAPLSPRVAEGTAARVEAARKRIESGEWDVFQGPVRDNTGTLRVEAGSAMSDDQMIRRFDWYVEGVIVDRD